MSQKISIEERLRASTIPGIHTVYKSGELSVSEVTKFFLDRIEQYNSRLNAVISINPEALSIANAQDQQLQSSLAMGPLFGIPILVKDNIETRELPTTAGSLALASNETKKDADVVQRLRAAGAIILGKSNLSEWANFRSSRSSSGWSAIGGQARNPYDLSRSTSGSSSGSGAGVAALLAIAALGTETNGSIIGPATLNGLVGLKPNISLVSQDGMVPISHSQDTAGPMTRSILDAAILLNVMACSEDTQDYQGALDKSALQDKRIGIVRSFCGFHEGVDEVFESAVEIMKMAGATIVDQLVLRPDRQFHKDAAAVLEYEFKHNLNRYLKGLPGALSKMTLESLITFNEEHAGDEMLFFKQEIFLSSQARGSLSDPNYLLALENVQGETRENGIDRLIKQDDLDVLIAPSSGAAWKIDPINGDHYVGRGTSAYPAISGYPHITLPMGTLHGLPLGISIMGPAFSESTLLSIAYSFEQHAKIDIAPELDG